ncbi:MAG: ATP-binding protein [Acidimicrobiales bacterium]
MRRGLTGSVAGIVLAVALGATMAPLRPHLSIAAAALVFVLPVVAGVIIGGFPAGMASVAAGFLVYDFVFLPPYYRLAVADPKDWEVLVIYSIVMLVMVRVVADLQTARSESNRRATETRRLFELSELLVEDRSVDDLLKTIVRVVASVFEVPGVALLVPDGDRLTIAASAGEELSDTELRQLGPQSGIPVSLGTAGGAPDGMHTVALTAAGRPVGMLALRGIPTSEADRALLGTFANHAALALERAQLREQALRTDLLVEIDRLRHALMGAVSHDLRTPLATMKVASSILLDPPNPLSDEDTHELHALIDLETDRLTRLVTSLLDLTRIDAGELEVRRAPIAVRDLVSEAVGSLQSALGDHAVEMAVPDGLPEVDVDQVLIGQVLANLLDNANRHTPAGSVITVTGELQDGRVAVTVSDQGPGVPLAEREAVFDRFVRFDTGGRAGLGLTIARTFVEAHGEHMWVEDAPGGGARFVFTLPLASTNGTDQQRT